MNNDNSSPYILIADDLSPTDTASLDVDQVAAFCTVAGGPTSHTVQVAYNLGIPTVVAAGPEIMEILDGEICAVDGDSGNLYAGLKGEDLAHAASFQKSAESQQLERRSEAGSLDSRILVTGTFVHTTQAIEMRAAGVKDVGLLATELLFLGRDTKLMDEEAHYETYMRVAATMSDGYAVLRTLDIGGDKAVSGLNIAAEDNSFLGVRGLRLTMRRQDLFLPQLRAVYRAARDSGCTFKLMFPMVTTVEEFRGAMALANRIRREVDGPILDLGVMVEVPSAALIADKFAEYVDFFSIGTNDLAQYVLAMGRTNSALASEMDPLHTAVCRSIRLVTDAAAAVKKPVSACGGLAGDPVGAVVLMALGVTSLTVATPMIPFINGLTRRFDETQLSHVREEALTTGGEEHMRSVVEAIIST
ncbi:putative PEP-binding protein [Streptomyces sp. NPDC051658]|uniref:putative PEP-binding protein n=1 Tax=Streptomyces sp. NPDC051658 TaxID=3365667 RepID=UPI0037A55B62